VKALFLKDDGRNPTGSLKDRASALGVVKAHEKRQKIISCASTGNAASSLAGMAASMEMRSVIFVPQRAPEPKVTQLLVFGATVLRVLGSYEDAFQLCQQACETWGWYNRNCAINPYLVEGKKTVGLEICEQLAWTVPDWVAVSVGDGCTIAGVWKAFRELKTLGLIPRTPRMLGVQAEGAAPITEAVRTTMGRAICRPFQNERGELPAISLAPTLESQLVQAIVKTEHGAVLALDPAKAQRLATKVADALGSAVAQPVLLCSPTLRPHLWRLLARVLPHLGVVSHNEVPPHLQIASVAVLD